MANFYLSANMSLPIPSVGIESGPDYANDVNASLTLIDSHDHSSGKGVQITPAGMNISTDLSFNSNNLISARSLRMSSQNAVLSLPADLDCLYVVDVDLYYNDGNGNNVRITQSGGVAGSPGSIANLISPASASYVSADSTFVWQSAASTPANLDAGAIIFRNLTASSNGITVSAPSALASNYTLTLPAIPGASGNFLTIDTSGNIGSSVAVDNSTLEVSSNNVQIKSQGITQGLLATRSTGTSVSAGGVAISTSSGGFSTSSSSLVDVTNLSVSITTTGRPVMVCLVAEGTSFSFIFVTATGYIALIRDVTQIAGMAIGSSSSAVTIPPVGALTVDPVAAGTYTYKIQAKVSSGTILVTGCKLIAYEI